MRRHPTLPVLLLAMALGACGTRGPLTLPQQPKAKAKVPATTTVAPAAADLNTPKEPD